MLVILFSLMRIGLVLSNWTPGLATYGQMAWAYLIGLRFDLVMAAYLAIPTMLVCYLPWTSPARGPKTRLIFTWWLSIVLSILALILIAEWEFFHEFQSRLNQLAVRYFNHPTTVLSMIWYNYPIIQYMLGWLVIALIIQQCVKLVIRQAYGKIGTKISERISTQSISGFFCLAIIIICARGGFQIEPVRWGDAFRGPNEFANQMGLNGLYSLTNAIRDMVGRNKTADQWSGKQPIDDAKKIVRQMIVAPDETLLDPDNRTVLRQGDSGSSLVLTTPDGKPMNVVVVMMESFSARFVGACGAERSFTPYFDGIAKDGVLFDRAFSAGSHTHQGIFATQLGFPNLPGFETLMESSMGNQQFLSLAQIFEQRKYQTFFLYNGDFAWDNMRGFFSKQGINSFIGGGEMKANAKYLDPVWGVSDGDLFDRANIEFEAAAKKGAFYAQIMTLSNHAPYQVPPVPGTSDITDMGEHNKRLQAMRYADYAVGKFIEDAKKLDYYKNTLFVFVGDHGFHVPPVLTDVHLLFHHVPLLFYAPGLTDQHRVDHRVAAHMNIVPSILGLLGLKETPQASWGRSLFNDSFSEGNFAVFKMSGGGQAVAILRDDKMLVLNSAHGKPQLMTYDLGHNPTVQPCDDPELEKQMESQLRSYIQMGIHDLTHFQAGPLKKE